MVTLEYFSKMERKKTTLKTPSGISDKSNNLKIPANFITSKTSMCPMRTSLREFHSQPCAFPWLFTHFLLTRSCPRISLQRLPWFPESRHGWNMVKSCKIPSSIICTKITLNNIHLLYVCIAGGFSLKILEVNAQILLDDASSSPSMRNRISERLVYLGEVVVTNSSQPEMYCLWWEDSVTDQARQAKMPLPRTIPQSPGAVQPLQGGKRPQKPFSNNSGQRLPFCTLQQRWQRPKAGLALEGNMWSGYTEPCAEMILRGKWQGKVEEKTRKPLVPRVLRYIIMLVPPCCGW